MTGRSSGYGQVLSDAEKKRIAELFDDLDVDKNGKVSISELKRLIKRDKNDGQAERVMKKGKDGKGTSDEQQMTLTEFVNYVRDTDTHLKLAFKQLDRNADNQIDPWEIQLAMADLGLTVSLNQAQKLLHQMDKDGSLTVDFNEWRDFLLFSGMQSLDLRHIFHYMHRCYAFDIGDNSMLLETFTEEEKASGDAAKTLVAGGLAGCVSRTATAPLDRIKTVWQARGGSGVSLLSSIRIMFNEGGLRSMWRGNGVNCIKIFPESAIKFQSFEYFKWLIQQRPGRGTISPEVTVEEKFVAGAAAGAFSQTIIYPIEVVKTRMCLGKTGQYGSAFDCARQLSRHYGPGIFFRGYVPTMLGILPYAGIDLTLFETFRTFYTRLYAESFGENESQKKLNAMYISLVAGASGSVFAQVATYPLALVRTKMQAQKETKKIGFATMLRSIYRSEGLPGLYRGIGPNMLKVIPAVSISYACYDHLRDIFGVSSCKK